MKTVRLGHSSVEVSTVCMGTDLIGSRIERDAAFELLDLFRESGGTFIDTGNFYSAWIPGCKGGESETPIGLGMKQRGVRSQRGVSTKRGFVYPGCRGALSGVEFKG